jgi:GTP pyrophosphokinase
MAVSPRFVEALSYAATLHKDQVRKGTPVPYVAHLLGVCSIAFEHGATEDEAIAALLHDAVEDQGGQPVLEEIRRRFGDYVAMIVEGCTDADTVPKPPWETRKRAYVNHLQTAPESVRLVSCADKLHNARSILADYRLYGEDLWPRFKGGRVGTLWYYRALADSFLQLGPKRIAEELNRVVLELEHLAGNGNRPARAVQTYS